MHDAIRTWGDDDHRLDIGCAATHGAFHALAGVGDIELEVWDQRAGTLVWFVTRLLSKLQAMATVPAIDNERWADVALQQCLTAPATADV